MKKNYLITLFCLLMLMASCKTNTEKESLQNNVTNTTDAVSNIDAQIVISKASGEKIGGFTLAPLTIFANAKKYTSKNKSDKHKFYTNGDLAYEVKLKSEGFKLRDNKSNLLWKIKIYPTKIKVSNNEENLNAFEIKKYDKKIKIKQNDKELYTIKLENASIIANDEMLYKISSNQESYAYAVLAINEIPEDQKIFILAELLKQL